RDLLLMMIPSLDVVLFFLFGGLAIAASVAVVAQRNPMHSVLFLIASFAALAGLYIGLDSPFTAVTQIIVYAGAIMVLFLFVVMRRTLITVLLSIEIMLNAVNLTFVAAGRHSGQVDGQVIVFFVMTVAAAEAAVGLALVISLFRHKESLSPDVFTSLKW